MPLVVMHDPRMSLYCFSKDITFTLVFSFVLVLIPELDMKLLLRFDYH